MSNQLSVRLCDGHDCVRTTAHKQCHAIRDMHITVRTVQSPKGEQRPYLRAPDTSPVEEGNPERKGMRNGQSELMPMVLASSREWMPTSDFWL